MGVSEINLELSEIFSLLAGYYTIERDKERARAFKNASLGVAEYNKPIQTGRQARDDIIGVGESSEQIIDEYLNTGQVRRLQDLEAKYADRKKFTDYFQSFYGIGPATASKFYDLGFRSITDSKLQKHLTSAQKTGIVWHEHLKIPIPRNEMNEIHRKIWDLLTPHNIHFDLAGSYRRSEATSGDVDILIEHTPNVSMTHILEYLRPIIIAELAVGDVKFMGICRLSEKYAAHRIDIRLIDSTSYPSALLYFTGSKRFNILMRQRAISLGLTLNEYGLYYNPTGEYYPITSEKEVFDLLHVVEIPPEGRTKTLDSLTFY